MTQVPEDTEHYNVTVKLAFDLLDVKHHKFIILSSFHLCEHFTHLSRIPELQPKTLFMFYLSDPDFDHQYLISQYWSQISEPLCFINM